MSFRGLTGRTAVAVACMFTTAATPALALPSRKLNREQRLCSTPRAGHAECLDERLISKSLTKSDLTANIRRQAREEQEGVKPAVTSKTVPAGLTPANLHAAYSMPTETPASATQTVAIVDAYNDPTVEADLGVYDQAFGLPACTAKNGCFKRVNEEGKASPLPGKNGEWSTEISLDVQMVHAICENCRILLVEAASTGYSDLGKAVQAAASAGATEISNSYGGAESSGINSVNFYYEHPGVVVTVSSGDCGYFNQGCNGTAAANFPAASPSVVAVGGTSLTVSEGSWSSKAWSDAGSGCSHVFSAQPWQSTAANFSATGCGSGRSVADVSAIGDPYTGVDVYDSTPSGSGASTGWGVWGGTSAASPIVAAEFALAGGARGVGNPADTLYSHLGESGNLQDSTSGSTGSCSSARSCTAASGYDGPTGVGSPVGLGAFAVSGTPANSAVPSVSGSAEQAQTLTATSGTWSASPAGYSYQWVLCSSSGSECQALSGATSSTLALSASAVGFTVRVVVGAHNGSGYGSMVESAATAVVASNVPSVTGFTPATAATGATIKITGSALRGATAVRFNGLSATFAVLSSTEIETVVPSGASAGKVTVVTPAKTVASSAKFTPSFSVTSESPSRAAVGATVTIKGAGFTSSSSVSFNGVAATSVTFVSATTIKAVVPAGASTGVVTVTTSAGSTHSAGSFVVS
jgi:subtilase family serine protease